MTSESGGAHRIDRAVAQLSALRDGEKALVDVISCGRAAIPALKRLLFSRSPDGIFEPRCLAARALGRLGARDVLLRFLGEVRDCNDPHEQTAEDAVVNAAARACEAQSGPGVLAALAARARLKPLDGVIEALGAYRRPEFSKLYVDALGEDFAADAAAQAIRQLGPVCRPDLLAVALEHGQNPTREYETHRRRRQRAAKLLADIDPGEGSADVLPLLDDADPRIALTACAILSRAVEPAFRAAIAGRLEQLEHCDDWMVREEARSLRASTNLGGPAEGEER